MVTYLPNIAVKWKSKVTSCLKNLSQVLFFKKCLSPSQWNSGKRIHLKYDHPSFTGYLSRHFLNILSFLWSLKILKSALLWNFDQKYSGAINVYISWWLIAVFPLKHHNNPPGQVHCTCCINSQSIKSFISSPLSILTFQNASHPHEES